MHRCSCGMMRLRYSETCWCEAAYRPAVLCTCETYAGVAYALNLLHAYHLPYASPAAAYTSACGCVRVDTLSRTSDQVWTRLWSTSARRAGRRPTATSPIRTLLTRLSRCSTSLATTLTSEHRRSRAVPLRDCTPASRPGRMHRHEHLAVMGVSCRIPDERSECDAITVRNWFAGTPLR